ncbi:radical SAM protein [Desulfovibrio mangrovi]|uniref:radical SAM protein n=1 Tax=Desulfovibrio mangrovi TaxID=2976983 RepID=UPI0022459B7F|nr:radical SAM protein [Desulfovibrio mangrovi]UZP67618.1 radical SAM protein [Desulfovibrio mangrovi]
MNDIPNPPEALLAVTYKCNAKCHMCNTWQFPSKNKDEVSPQDLEKLPGGYRFANVTGGEPFLRKDIEDIIEVVLSKTDRMVVSTNGFYTDRVLAVAERFFPRVGFRISIEGLPAANDELRGLKNGFDHGVRTLLGLRQMGLEDIGFGTTVSDRNAKDMVELYELAEAMGLEFATAAMHNTYYFHKFDNEFHDVEMISSQFKRVAERLLKTNRPKNWFRAYFNYGLANYVRGNERLLPCEVGSDLFFMDPYGEIRPCNGMEESMGNIKAQSFEEIWNSDAAKEVRSKVGKCDKQCWMVGSAAPAMKKDLATPAKWVIKNKLRSLMGKEINWRFK